MEIQLRLAILSDADFLLTCRNDIKTRENSHNIDKVKYADHIEWLKKIIHINNLQEITENPIKALYVAVENGILVGTIRADYLDKIYEVGDGYELSWTVAPNARGKGIGKKMIKSLSSRINKPIYAEIKKENIASINIATSISMKIYKEVNGIYHFIKN